MLALQLVPSWPVAGLVMLVGLVATLGESLLGALVQDRVAWLSNELVNALQTLLAAVLAMLLMALYSAALDWDQTIALGPLPQQSKALIEMKTKG